MNSGKVKRARRDRQTSNPETRRDLHAVSQDRQESSAASGVKGTVPWQRKPRSQHQSRPPPITWPPPCFVSTDPDFDRSADLPSVSLKGRRELNHGVLLLLTRPQKTGFSPSPGAAVQQTSGLVTTTSFSHSEATCCSVLFVSNPSLVLEAY